MPPATVEPVGNTQKRIVRGDNDDKEQRDEVGKDKQYSKENCK